MTDLEDVPPSVAVDTSEDAADAIAAHCPALRRAVLRTLAAQPLTCDQIEFVTGLPHQTVGPRLREPADRGCIARTDLRRPTRTGRPAYVWAITTRGAHVLALHDARTAADAA